MINCPCLHLCSAGSHALDSVPFHLFKDIASASSPLTPISLTSLLSCYSKQKTPFPDVASSIYCSISLFYCKKKKSSKEFSKFSIFNFSSLIKKTHFSQAVLNTLHGNSFCSKGSIPILLLNPSAACNRLLLNMSVWASCTPGLTLFLNSLSVFFWFLLIFLSYFGVFHTSILAAIFFSIYLHTLIS